MRENRHLPMVAATLLVAFAVIAMGQGLFSRTTIDPSLGAFIWGEQGFGGLAIGVTTLFAGLITVALLFRRDKSDQEQLSLARRTLDLTRTSELGARFKAGVEMLAASDAAVALGGVYLLRDVATAAPGDYRATVIHMLVEFARSRCAERFAAFHARPDPTHYIPGERESIEDRRKWATSKTERPVSEAINVVGHLLRAERDEGEECRTLDLSGIILADCLIENGNFEQQRITNTVLSNVYFNACNLNGTEVRVDWKESININRSTLRRASVFGVFDSQARISISTSDISQAFLEFSEAKCSITACLIDYVKFTAGKFAVKNCWLTNVERLTATDAEVDWDCVFIVEGAQGKMTAPDDGGPPIFRPADSDVRYRVVDGSLLPM